MSSKDIKLTFINESNDQDYSNVVIYQTNEAVTFGEIAVAWKVIKNNSTGWQQSFPFSTTYQIGAQDAQGNPIGQLIETNSGQKFQVYNSPAGDEIGYVGPETNTNAIELKNNLAQGTIDANLYNDGKLLATQTGIAPQQSAVFQFSPTIRIGVANEVEEGEIMNSAVLSAVNTELNLLGIASADIVMTGGGTQPFAFTLKNVK